MYASLAKYYDTFMHAVDYQKWIDYTAQFLQPLSVGVDLACGTGKFTIGLSQKGFEVLGVDSSIHMLSKAAKNAKKSMCKLEFVLGDMTEFKPAKPVDFVTAMCDAINYIANPQKMFDNVYKMLNKNGIFVFDISTSYKLKTVLGNNTYSDTSGSVTYIWNNFLNSKQTKVDMELTFFEKQGDMYKKSSETQTQYIHTKAKLKKALTTAGFEILGVYSELTKQSAKENDQRIHFVAKKAGE